MLSETKIQAQPIPDYHIAAAAARREQSLAVRGAISGAASWVRKILNPGASDQGMAEHLG